MIAVASAATREFTGVMQLSRELDPATRNVHEDDVKEKWGKRWEAQDILSGAVDSCADVRQALMLGASLALEGEEEQEESTSNINIRALAASSASFRRKSVTFRRGSVTSYSMTLPGHEEAVQKAGTESTVKPAPPTASGKKESKRKGKEQAEEISTAQKPGYVAKLLSIFGAGPKQQQQQQKQPEASATDSESDSESEASEGSSNNEQHPPYSTGDADRPSGLLRIQRSGLSESWALSGAPAKSHVPGSGRLAAAPMRTMSMTQQRLLGREAGAPVRHVTMPQQVDLLNPDASLISPRPASFTNAPIPMASTHSPGSGSKGPLVPTPQRSLTHRRSQELIVAAFAAAGSTVLRQDSAGSFTERSPMASRRASGVILSRPSFGLSGNLTPQASYTSVGDHEDAGDSAGRLYGSNPGSESAVTSGSDHALLVVRQDSQTHSGTQSAVLQGTAATPSSPQARKPDTSSPRAASNAAGRRFSQVMLGSVTQQGPLPPAAGTVLTGPPGSRGSGPSAAVISTQRRRTSTMSLSSMPSALLMAQVPAAPAAGKAPAALAAAAAGSAEGLGQQVQQQEASHAVAAGAAAMGATATAATAAVASSSGLMPTPPPGPPPARG